MLEARGCEVTFQHVQREFNAEAYALAKSAIDAVAFSLMHTSDFASARTRLPLMKPDAGNAGAGDKDIARCT